MKLTGSRGSRHDAPVKIERYHGVHGERNVAAITAALEKSGATILSGPDATVAPFDYAIRTPQGEEVDLVCYVFTANKYKQGGRPSDEHRFQVKYGSDFSRYHKLYIDPSRRTVTLMFGVHHEMGLFVAVDPVMHNPTWFSMSVEMKQANLDDALDVGWAAWERERSAARRKIDAPLLNLQTEAVCAFRPEFFLRYVAFERVASGLDTGERLLLADRIGRAASLCAPVVVAKQHPLEEALGLSAAEILDVLGGSFRLLVAVRGSVAEHHLETILRSAAGVTEVQRIDEDGQPDFKLRYRARSFRIECKNVLRRMHKDGVPRVDFQKTRASQNSKCSRYYDPKQFELLAACLHPVSERWEYRFCSTRALPPHEECPGKLSSKVAVEGHTWSDTVTQALDAVIG
jgi:hypothetical protein